MLGGSASCFQLCPTQAALPQQSSSWMCTSPTVAEMSPVPIQICSKGVLLSPIWPYGTDGGGSGDLHCLSCPCVPVVGGGRAGPLQCCPLRVGGCGIKSECLHPSVAGGQQGRSAPYLIWPAIRSRRTRCKWKDRKTVLLQWSMMVGMCQDPTRERGSNVTTEKIQ